MLRPLIVYDIDTLFTSLLLPGGRMLAFHLHYLLAVGSFWQRFIGGFSMGNHFWSGEVAPFLVALALALAGCAQKREAYSTLNGNIGSGKCNGSMGSIDVFVKARQGDPSRYDLVLVPKWVGLANELATVTIVQKASYQYREMASQITLSSLTELNVGVLTIEQLNFYDVLAITTYQGGVSFLQAKPARSAICSLPYPGDNLTN